MPIESFVDEARSKLGIHFPDNYNMINDFVNRFEKNNHMLKMLEKLQNDFQLGVITNQYPNMLNTIFKRKFIPSKVWNVIIDSSFVKMIKPQPEIYIYAEKMANVEPKSILFVDNKADLLKYPKSRGWNVFEYDPSDALTSTKNLQKFIYENK